MNSRRTRRRGQPGWRQYSWTAIESNNTVILPGAASSRPVDNMIGAQAFAFLLDGIRACAATESLSPPSRCRTPPRYGSRCTATSACIERSPTSLGHQTTPCSTTSSTASRCWVRYPYRPTRIADPWTNDPYRGPSAPGIVVCKDGVPDRVIRDAQRAADRGREFPHGNATQVRAGHRRQPRPGPQYRAAPGRRRAPT